MTTLRTYIIGFGLSLFLTFLAFGAEEQHVLSDHQYPTHEFLFPFLIGLALLQLLVQLICFLHVGRETKPRWNLLALVFAFIVVGILVGGTLWIMHNLDQGHAAVDKTFIGGEITPQAEND
jgi:cytochrome o ubiquinol oxidase operon protein cyoD